MNNCNYKKDIKNIIQHEMFEKDISIKNFEAPTCIFISRLLSLINKIDFYEDKIKEYYLELIKNIKNKEIILSNGFYQTEDKILYHFLKNNNNKIISFDHGVSIGMDKLRSSYVDKYSGVIGDVGVYSNNKGSVSIKKFNPLIKRIVAGQLDRYKTLFNIRKIILKLYYSIPLKKKVIFIVIGPHYNNTFFSPYRERDRKLVRFNKRLVNKICKEKKEYQIILKLYPGSRYYNEYNYSDLKKINNLKIIKNKDFRWLRYMADIVVTHCSDSTLGQINYINAKSYFYKFNDRPINFEEYLQDQNDFKGMRNLKRIKKGLFNKINFLEVLKEF